MLSARGLVEELRLRRCMWCPLSWVVCAPCDDCRRYCLPDCLEEATRFNQARYSEAHRQRKRELGGGPGKGKTQCPPARIKGSGEESAPAPVKPTTVVETPAVTVETDVPKALTDESSGPAALSEAPQEAPVEWSLVYYGSRHEEAERWRGKQVRCPRCGKAGVVISCSPAG